ncbi:MAG: glycosyltransferase family protein [Pirellulales bacterium]|nr:glycosyltransferase family protein [Pirellulales bacterium]
MTVVAIIQARMGSTRLPGKVLSDLCGKSMLARVCDRVRRARRIDRLVVATTREAADQAVVEACDRLRVACFRGSSHDVLDRYCRAARALGADVVVRITADCPLIDPEVVDRVVHAFLEHQPDYASNTLRRTWPRGLDTEVATCDALERADREATETYARTHVTPYLYRHGKRFRLFSVEGTEDFSDHRWTVDLPEDLEFVRAVYGHLGQPEQPECFSWRDVLQLLTRKPALAEMNRHVRQKQLAEG